MWMIYKWLYEKIILNETRYLSCINWFENSFLRYVGRILPSLRMHRIAPEEIKNSHGKKLEIQMSHRCHHVASERGIHMMGVDDEESVVVSPRWQQMSWFLCNTFTDEASYREKNVLFKMAVIIIIINIPQSIFVTDRVLNTFFWLYRAACIFIQAVYLFYWIFFRGRHD